MKTSEELQAAVEILLLSETTRDLIKARLRDHLSLILNSEGRAMQDAVGDMVNDFRNIGLA